MRLRLRRPRELATALRDRARREPRDVEDYLAQNRPEWRALAEADPGDAADILEYLGDDAAVELIADLRPEEAAGIIDDIRDDLVVDVLEQLSAEEAAGILDAMPVDDAADALGTLDDELQERLLDAMDNATPVRQLLTYPPDSAGGLMTTRVATLPIGITAGEAIEVVRRLHEELEDLLYVYVVEDDSRLMGVLSFRDLVFNRPGAGIDEVMVARPVTVTPETDREAVAELAERYNLFAIPVVDDSGRLLGAVETEAVIESIRQEASEDFAAAVGAGAEETVYTDVLTSLRNRTPWMLVNLILGLLVALALERNTDVLREFDELGALMPIVALLGGNAGAQSLAVIIRALATDDVPRNEVPGIVGRQATIGLVNGLLLGMLSGGIGVLFGSVEFGFLMFVAATANVLIATVAGTVIPLTFRALGRDPALASNIFLTLISDLVGFGGFLAVATVLLA